MNNTFKFGLGFVVIMATLAFTLSASAAGPLTVSINTPTNNSSYTVGSTITLNGTVSGGTGVYVSYKWSFSDGTAQIIGQNQTVKFNTVGKKTITLSQMDSDGTVGSVSTVVDITAAASAKPVISNIATSNITQTSVTITWTTNIPATSYVVYDTVSHADITGATAPNFGYAAKTDEIDLSTKVTSHTVTVTNLNPGTKYFFRVLSRG